MESRDRQISRIQPPSVPDKIQIFDKDVSLDGLTDEQIQQIKIANAKAILEASAQAEAQDRELAKLREELAIINQSASEASSNGHSMSWSKNHTHSDGNSTTTIRSRSPQEMLIFYIIGAVVVIIVVVLALVAMHK